MIDMTQGSPSKLVLRFAAPLLLGNVLQQTYNLVDSIVVGNFVGTEALAAVGGSFIILFLLTSLFMGLGLGATILISQFFGAGRKDRVKAVIDTMYIGMAVGALAVTVLGFIAARPVLQLLKTPEGITLEWSVLYLQTLFIGSIASFGYNVNAGILQGIGDSKTTLLFLAISTVVNIALDLLFVVVFKWGVFGVALATVIAQVIAFVFGIWYINARVPLLHISFRNMTFDPVILVKCVRIGLPAGIQNVLFSLGSMALQRLVNSYGANFMAGFSAVGKIDSFAFMPIVSFSSAITTYVGQNVGAQKMDRVKAGVRSTVFMSIGVCVVISILVIFLGRFLLMAFTQDLEVLKIGHEFILRLMPMYFLLAIMFIINSALRGAGESMLPLFGAILSLLCARVPAAYILNHFFGRYELFWCFPISWLVGLMISLPYYLSGRWKAKALITIHGDAQSSPPSQ